MSFRKGLTMKSRGSRRAAELLDAVRERTGLPLPVDEDGDAWIPEDAPDDTRRLLVRTLDEIAPDAWHEHLEVAPTPVP